MVEPASIILALLGGPTPVARSLKVGANTASRWQYPKSKGGTDGFIPRKYHDRLIAIAERQGITLPRLAFIDPAVARKLAPKRKRRAA